MVQYTKLELMFKSLGLQNAVNLNWVNYLPFSPQIPPDPPPHPQFLTPIVCFKLGFLGRVKSLAGVKKSKSGKEISTSKPTLSVFTSGGQLLEADTFHLRWASSRGQWQGIGRLLCFPLKTDVKVSSIRVELHCQQLQGERIQVLNRSPRSYDAVCSIRLDWGRGFEILKYLHLKRSITRCVYILRICPRKCDSGAEHKYW